MELQFNRPVTLGKMTYGKGVHQVPAEDCAGWLYEAMVKEGGIVVLRDDEKPAKAPKQAKTAKAEKAAAKEQPAPDDEPAAEAETAPAADAPAAESTAEAQ